MSQHTAPYISSDCCWKIHLNVPRDSNNPTVRQLIALCEKQNVDYKVGLDGDQEGKGMTIYAGTRLDVERIARAIEDLEDSNKLPHMEPAAGEVFYDNMPIGREGRPVSKVWARFCATKYSKVGHKLDFHQYGCYGLPILDGHMEMLALKDKRILDRQIFKKRAWRESYKILETYLGESFTGVPKGQRPKWAEWVFASEARLPSWWTSNEPTAPASLRVPKPLQTNVIKG